MITSYYENDQIDRTKQIATSLDPFDYNQPRSFDELTGHVNFNIVMTGSTSLSVLQYNLENDNLPVARIGWQNDQGHFILIVGVINVNGEYGVLYNDPWNGVQQYLPFEKFSGEGTLQDGTWTHTALTYKK